MTIQSDLERIEELKLLLNILDKFYAKQSCPSNVIIDIEDVIRFDDTNFPALKNLLIETAKDYLSNAIAGLKKSLVESEG